MAVRSMPSNSVGGSARRLRVAFRRALLAAAAAASTCALGAIALGACDTADDDEATTSTGSTGSTLPDAGPDADADVDPCAPTRFAASLPKGRPDGLPGPVAAPDQCGSFVRFACGMPEGIEVTAGPGCYISQAQCKLLCLDIFFSCRATDEECDADGVFHPKADGSFDVDCITCPGGIGRVPEGLVRGPAPQCPSAIGVYFARAAELERASVVAFERLADELRAARAPARLVRGALASAREERGHGRSTARLARRFGARPHRARVRDVGARSLEALARENAIEGCVREAFGALVAAHQAASAKDPGVRRVLAKIADEEARHAALSFDVLRWSTRRLDGSARSRIAAGMRAAIAAITEPDDDLAPATRADLGLPGRAARLAMARTLRAHLWDATLVAL